ncbi:MAG: hypothetical protein ABEK59_11760 [Halobacteria archaeon]
MTSIQYVDNVLQNNWTSSISGRPHDVESIGENPGDVRIIYGSDDEFRRMDLSNNDYLVLRDGGLAEITPKSFSWQEEDRISRVDVDIRTSGWPNSNRPGRIALYGERGAGNLNSNESPRWGGLVGEALRVLKTKRKGDQEFTIINASEADDVSEQMGGQVWRTVVGVRLEQRNISIDTST